MSRGIPLLRVLGWEIRVHLSWLVVIAFLVASLGTVDLPGRYPGWPDAASWAVAGLAAAGLFGGVLLHEIAHVFVARRAGVPPRPVTLLLFGAPAALEGGAATPGAEAAIALAGPLASGAFAGLSIAAGLALAAGPAGSAAGGQANLSVAVAQALLTTGILNLIVAALNLVPIYPLDAARLLRAIAWRVSGDPARGTRAAALSGRIVGISMVGAGVMLAFSGNVLDGFLLAILGWSVRGASGALGRREELEVIVERMRVADVMERDLPEIPPQVTLDTFADVIVGPSETTVLPVVSLGRFLGLVGLRDLRRAGRRAWPTTHASEVMALADALPVLAPGDLLRFAIERLQASGADGVPVMEDGKLAGVLTRYGVGRALQERLAAARTAHAVDGR